MSPMTLQVADSARPPTPLPSREAAVDWTIIICTHNGASRLPPTLQALAALSLRPREIVLVDNASSDDSASVSQYWAERLGLPLRVVTERRAGLAWARLAGMRAARGSWLCFVDDDNELAVDYLEVATTRALADPQLGALGGRSRLPADRRPPPWWPAHAASFAVGQPHPRSAVLEPGMSLWGAGLCLRRAAADQLLHARWTPQLTGRLGARALSGDDSELCLAVQLLGWKLAYEHDLCLTHAIDPRRMQTDTLTRMHAAWGATQPVLRIYDRQLHGQRSSAAIYAYLWTRCLAWSWMALALWLRLKWGRGEAHSEAALALRCRFHRYRSAVWSCSFGLGRVRQAQRQATALVRGVVR